MNNEDIKIRTEVRPGDRSAVEKIVTSTGFFRSDEIKVAVELIEEKLTQGDGSGYEFVFAEIGDQVAAYVCFGLIPCSLISYDLYWIATDKDYQKKGLGKLLLEKTEDIVRAGGGKAIYIETSSRPLYEPTRVFYLRNGYQLKARLEDFYDISDDKLIFFKRL
ncbi:MAG TPA: GNAT family N-acetyltransferase [Bacteroidales bacterium]|nr:GNAT family N-acetyltransferase [Bacteroidales bacterium]